MRFAILAHLENCAGQQCGSCRAAKGWNNGIVDAEMPGTGGCRGGWNGYH